MARPISVVTRERADLYATRAMMAELIRYLARNDPQIGTSLRLATKHGSLKPVAEDVVVSEENVRESFEAILKKAGV